MIKHSFYLCEFTKRVYVTYMHNMNTIYCRITHPCFTQANYINAICFLSFISPFHRNRIHSTYNLSYMQEYLLIFFVKWKWYYTNSQRVLPLETQNAWKWSHHSLFTSHRPYHEPLLRLHRPSLCSLQSIPYTNIACWATLDWCVHAKVYRSARFGN